MPDMTDTKYTEGEITWAIGELKKKHPERANREQAIKLLDSFKEFSGIIANTLKKDKRSGKIPKTPMKIRN